MTSRFRENRHYEAAEVYGRHSSAHANVPIEALLRRVIASDEAIRLAWPVEGSDQLADGEAWPTAVLPRVRQRSTYSTGLIAGNHWLIVLTSSAIKSRTDPIDASCCGAN